MNSNPEASLTETVRYTPILSRSSRRTMKSRGIDRPSTASSSKTATEQTLQNSELLQLQLTPFVPLVPTSIEQEMNPPDTIRSGIKHIRTSSTQLAQQEFTTLRWTLSHSPKEVHQAYMYEYFLARWYIFIVKLLRGIEPNERTFGHISQLATDCLKYAKPFYYARDTTSLQKFVPLLADVIWLWG